MPSTTQLKALFRQYDQGCIRITLCLFLAHMLLANGALVSSEPPETVPMDFQNATVRNLAAYVGEITGRNFIVDPDIEETVTIIAPTEVPVHEVLGFFQSVLEVHGYTMVKAANMIKIVPSVEARSKGIETITGPELETASDELTTQVVRVNYLTPVEAKNLLSPLLSGKGVIIVYPRTGALIITDSCSNIRRLQRLLRALDLPSG